MTDIENTQEMHVFRVEDPNCGKTFVILVTEEEYEAWKDGVILSDAMPHLSEEETRLLINGTCADCWGEKITPEPADPAENDDNGWYKS